MAPPKAEPSIGKMINFSFQNDVCSFPNTNMYNLQK